MDPRLCYVTVFVDAWRPRGHNRLCVHGVVIPRQGLNSMTRTRTLPCHESGERVASVGRVTKKKRVGRKVGALFSDFGIQPQPCILLVRPSCASMDNRCRARIPTVPSVPFSDMKKAGEGIGIRLSLGRLGNAGNLYCHDKGERSGGAGSRG